MMNRKEIIAELFINILADAYFVDFENIAATELQIEAPLCSQMIVTLPYMGSFVSIFPLKIAEEMTMNVMDIKSPEVVLDTINEWQNVFVGKVLERFYPNTLFELDLPKIVPLESINPSDFFIQAFESVDGQKSYILHKIKD